VPEPSLEVVELLLQVVEPQINDHRWGSRAPAGSGPI